MKTKDKAFQKYKLYEDMLAHQRGIHIKTLVTDRGGEYTSDEFNEHLAKQGTNHRLTVHDTLESNGVTEQLNRTLVGRTHAMLLDSKLPKFLWGYAILHANYMKNRMHTCTLLNKTPFKMVNYKKSDLHTTHQRGSEVYVKIKQGDQLSSRATRDHWIEFSSKSDGHCICMLARVAQSHS